MEPEKKLILVENRRLHPPERSMRSRPQWIKRIMGAEQQGWHMINEFVGFFENENGVIDAIVLRLPGKYHCLIPLGPDTIAKIKELFCDIRKETPPNDAQEQKGATVAGKEEPHGSL